LNFAIVINPDNGPGNSTQPNEDFVPGLERLSTYSNARTLGYVRTEYGERNISDVLRDVATYANWSTTAANLSVSGIFFDETVSEYNLEAATYLIHIDNAAKNATGIREQRLVGQSKSATKVY
jgi:hypothetical protein